jgi:hypothetical protein
MSDQLGTPLGSSARAAVQLVGRDREQTILNQFMFAVRSGQSRALVLRGDAGAPLSAPARC